ncbi:MAG: CBS domain-containing protein [Nanoarchaeota archaeon]|nr:CBS domain-containing protein [Nanoarchaeota archaeon]MBU1004700.1 CBS domain-containing protein [Nanoarchaeota archaeon]MBU1945746.1 CBS domain-containing protein [Nanoarchaeota archaeon]
MKTGITVMDAMTQKPIVLSPLDSIKYCSEEMEKHHVSTIIVEENKKALGVISEQDIVRNILAKGLDPYKMKLEDVMEKEIITIKPEADIFEALVKMRDLNIRHLPVINDGNLIGLLTLKDILKIEPQLFELMVEKFELREEQQKPINRISPQEGICQLCGEYAEKLNRVDSSMMCDACKKAA